MRRRAGSNFSQVQLKYLFIAPAALVIQIAVSHVPTAIFGIDLRPAGLVTSYLLLFAFLVINRRHLGILILGVGLLMNLAAILANGGFMPTTAEAVMNAGLEDRIAGLESGDIVPQTTIVLLDKSQIRLWFLSDILSIRSPLKRVFSVGDIFVVVGVVLILVQLVLNAIMLRSATSEARQRIGQDAPS